MAIKGDGIYVNKIISNVYIKFVSKLKIVK